MPDCSWNKILRHLKNHIVITVWLTAVWRHWERSIRNGNKSAAFRVKFQAKDRTLTESEVNSIHTKIVKLLENRFGGKIRAS
ncbi:hypothetical protein [Undibacterium luofuense]|uniref:phenylalanine--tRNA ligase subunit beta-related protein n=1 Tax=Undibacterium luofuense TaxID=2828733 RepID=UPI003C6F88DA